ncbi:MAG: hypothetical protein U0166_19415 [Acidobacteriota bacterium]
MTRGAALVFALALALDIPVVSRGLVLEDEGATIAIAERLSRGEVLYRDAPINLGPAVYELYGLLFRATGTSYRAARFCVSMASASCAALLFVLARSAGAPTAGAAIAPWLFVLMRPFAFPSWHMALYTPFAMALCLGALALAFSPATAAAFGAGTLAGLAAVFKQNYGALALVGVLPLFFTGPRRVARCGALGAGFALPPAAFALLFVARGAFADFFAWSVRFALGSQRQVFHVPAPPIFPLAGPDTAFRGSLLYYIPPLVWETLFPAFASSATYQTTGRLELCLKAAFYVPWLASPLLLFLPGAGARRARALALFALVFLALGSVPSCDWAHLCYAIPPTFAVAAALLGRGPRVRAASFMALALATAGTGLFFIRALAPYTYPIPRLHLRVPEPFGRALLQASEVLEKRGVSQVLVVPYQPGFYHVSGTRNPTHADIFLPEFMDQRRRNEVGDALDAATLVVRFGKEYAHLAPFERGFPELHRRLLGEPLATIGGDGRAGFEIRIVAPSR